MNKQLYFYKICSDGIFSTIKIMGCLLDISTKEICLQIGNQLDSDNYPTKNGRELGENLYHYIKHQEKYTFPQKYFGKITKAMAKIMKKHETNPYYSLVMNAIDDLEKLEKVYFFVAKAYFPIKPETINEFQSISAQFIYKLQKSFDAFKTMQLDDLIVIGAYLNMGESKQREIDKVLPSWQEILISSNKTDIVNDVAKWMDAEKVWFCNKISNTHNTTHSATRSAEESWYIICNKMKELAQQNTIGKNFENGVSLNDNTYLVLLWFIDFIWPKNGATDTEFGPQHIDLLIRFKYGLDSKEKKRLIDLLTAPDNM